MDSGTHDGCNRLQRIERNPAGLMIAADRCETFTTLPVS
jgi:hypothetical protein